MEKRPAHLFCGLSTFVLLLYSVEVSSAPTAQKSMLDVMKNDPELCKTAVFLYESNVTKTCANLDYPTDNVVLDYTNTNTFLCLGVYDAAYKVCHYSSHWQKPFDSTEAFYSYIQSFFPHKEEADRTKFCQSVTNVTPIYEKTKPLLSMLIKYLNKPHGCDKLCFNLDDEFNPLCAIIAWSKSVDEAVKQAIAIPNSDAQTTVVAKKESTEHKQKQSSQVSSMNKPGKVATGSNNDSTTSISNADPLNNLHKQAVSSKEKQPQESMVNTKELSEAAQEKPKDLNVNPPSAIQTDNAHPKNENSMNNDKPLSSSPSKDIDHVDQADLISKQDANNAPQISDESVINANKESNSKGVNEEVKTSTISENTQDRNDLINQEEYNHLGDERLPYDPDDGPDQPLDTGDQNQNMPEPSEQRDIIPRYHSMRSDEESHSFTYFTVISLVCIAAYIGYHNKQKILAIVLEGRRSRNNRGRRRPSTSSYRKLDCTLEEAVTSQCNANVTHVIY